MCKEQEFFEPCGGLSAALETSLTELSELQGSEVRAKFRMMRDELIRKFKESGIPANRELDHAMIVRPSIEAVEKRLLSYSFSRRPFADPIGKPARP